MKTQHPELMNGFKGLGKDATQVDPTTEAACATLVSIMYSCGDEASLDTIRYNLFAKIHNTSKKKNYLPQRMLSSSI